MHKLFGMNDKLNSFDEKIHKQFIQSSAKQY